MAVTGSDSRAGDCIEAESQDI